MTDGPPEEDEPGRMSDMSEFGPVGRMTGEGLERVRPRGACELALAPGGGGDEDGGGIDIVTSDVKDVSVWLLGLVVSS